jgi:hypothetical protein
VLAWLFSPVDDFSCSFFSSLKITRQKTQRGGVVSVPDLFFSVPVSNPHPPHIGPPVAIGTISRRSIDTGQYTTDIYVQQEENNILTQELHSFTLSHYCSHQIPLYSHLVYVSHYLYSNRSITKQGNKKFFHSPLF